MSLVSNAIAPRRWRAKERVLIANDAVIEALIKTSRTGFVADVPHERIVDVGPKAAGAAGPLAAASPFCFMERPSGRYEQGYEVATTVVAQALVQSGVQAVVGGGDTIARLKNIRLTRLKSLYPPRWRDAPIFNRPAPCGDRGP